MSKGYSIAMKEQAESMAPDSLGSRLALFCIGKGIPVATVAAELGVTRATIYNWFSGVWTPNEAHQEKIEAFMQAQDTQ